MPETLLLEIKRRITELALHAADHEVLADEVGATSDLENEISEILDRARSESGIALNDPAHERGLVRKVFPAGLPGLSDYCDIPDSPQVLVEHAAQQAGIIGQSPEIVNAVRRALLIAQTRARVLITGETGTGKDIFAKLVHQNSPRKHKEFVVVNCGALDQHLAVSELFGHEPHSFTGADPRGRIGKVEAAHGGTLFLDEIADLPMVAQAALLRLLDRGEIQTIGKNKPRQVDVRIISATHRNLAEMVESGQFRADLYYRLFVAEITLPPLRERTDDILSLATHVLNVLRIEYGRSTPCGFTETAQRILLNASWPGNIRQLNHVIEHAFIETSEELIGADQLSRIRRAASETPSPLSANHSLLVTDVRQAVGTQSPKLIRFLSENGAEWFTTSTVAEFGNVSESLARMKLRMLADAGVLESEGERRGRRYRLAPRYALDFPSKNSDINGLGELE